MRRRRGTNLVEVMIVVTITAFLISAVAVCLHGLNRHSLRSQRDNEQCSALARLSLAFREDVHRSQSFETAIDGEGRLGVMLSQAGGRKIFYVFAADCVERRVFADPSPPSAPADGGAAPAQHRDAFRLPGVQRVSWSVSDGAAPLATMTVSHAGEPGQRDGGWDEEIQALVALQARGGHVPTAR
jgi:Tfp pilus assembly protein PilE